MNIAIDFDNTLTADPDLFCVFAEYAKKLGHRVFIVTQRQRTEENVNEIEEYLAERDCKICVYYTEMQSKLDYMKNRGVKVAIWIDDDPEALVHGR